MKAFRSPTEDQIRKRAYEIYLQRNRQPGHEMDDWLQAEYELVQLPIDKIAELHTRRPKSREKTASALVSLAHVAVLLAAEGVSHARG